MLPIFMDMRDRRAVIVGGGNIASRKAALIARSGATITIVSPAICDSMRRLVDKNAWDWAVKSFADEDLSTACIAIAATDDESVNRMVHDAATRLRIPVNVVDTPGLCTFILPAIVDRSPIVVAVSTGGRSPVLARYVRSILERMLPARLGRLGELCGGLRARLRRSFHDSVSRRRYWDALFESSFAELVFAGREKLALERAADLIDDHRGNVDARRGEVYLIGAGPGDPELLTLKAQRLLQRADIVLFDRLVPVSVLDLCRREAELVYVGKMQGDHPFPQQEIGALLVQFANDGKRVARLKGGDPFIFGRGGEELEALVTAGIDFQVVPGISAANGAASYAGIPLTHRDHAQGVSFWTGHRSNGELELPWPSMASSGHTLVFFMALANASRIGKELIAHGMVPSTPAAIVRAATTPLQEVHRSSLRHLGRLADSLDNSLPSIVIVGSVVTLRRDLDWFDTNGNSGQAIYPPHLSKTHDRTGNSAA